jgi:hypothetical protein
VPAMAAEVPCPAAVTAGRGCFKHHLELGGNM